MDIYIFHIHGLGKVNLSLNWFTTVNAVSIKSPAGSLRRNWQDDYKYTYMQL